mgnify:CR=1 FL=1
MTLQFGWLMAVIVIYLGILLLILRWTGRKEGDFSSGQFFLGRDGNRGLHPSLLLLSYAATVYSAFTVVGIPAAIYERGIGAYGFMVLAQLLQVACVILFGIPLWRKAQTLEGCTSPIEVISRCYGSRILGVIVAVTTVIFVIPHVAMQLVGIGLLLNGFSEGGISYELGVGIVLLVMLIYSELGGFRGIVWTDVIQFVLLVLGMWVVALLFVQLNWQGSFSEIFNDLRNHERRELLTTPGPTHFYTLPMLISYVLFIGMWPIGHPSFSVRYLALTRRSGFVWLVGGMSLLPAIMFLPSLIIGLGGAARYPDLSKPNLVAGEVVQGVIATGGMAATIFGFCFILGGISAAMSTCDSQALAMGQIISRDVVRRFLRPNISARKELWIARLAIVAVMITAYVIGLKPPAFIIKLSVLSAMGTAILAPTYLGIRLQRPNPTAAVSSILSGFAMLAAGELGGLPENWLYGFHNGVLAIAVATGVFIFISLIQPNDEQRQQN